MKVVRHIPQKVIGAIAPEAPTLLSARLNNPNRTEILDANGNWLATFTDGCSTVTHKGPMRTFTQQDLPINDLFNRTRNGTGWGNATQGGTWSSTGGTDPGNYSVESGIGKITADTENSSRRLSISSYAVQDADVQTKFSLDKIAKGANQVFSLLLGYQDTNNHYTADVSFKPTAIEDSFTRNTTSSWGNSDSGQAWSTLGGASTDYATNGAEGTHSMGSINASRRTIITGASGTDFDITVRIKTDALATGASSTGGIMARYIDSNNHYYFRVRYGATASHNIFASIQKTVAGTSTTLGSEVTTSYTHVANSYVWIRAQGTGSGLRLRVWQDGNSEPATWDIDIVDTTFTGAGSIGLRSILQTGTTNALPVLFSYDSLNAIFEGSSNDAVEIRLRKRVSGTNTDIGQALVIPGVTRSAGEYFHIRASLNEGNLRAKTWKDGSVEPTSWQITENDTAFVNGKVGLRLIANTGTQNLPIVASVTQFYANGSWVLPPLITHDTWVRLLPSPFNGTVDQQWLITSLQSVKRDILSIAMEYVPGAPAVTNTTGLQVAGDAAYGPIATNGTRIEGADFNDYLGVDWTYTGVDYAEPAEFKALDCSGYIRMVFGYRGGMSMRLSAPATDGGNSIPRTSKDMTDFGPGVVIVPNNGSTPTELSTMMIGDLVAFDATNEVGELDNEIDHIGIYMGTDQNGNLRFISSRKSINGPTLSDTGGPSILNGTGTYARTFRKVRRF